MLKVQILSPRPQNKLATRIYQGVKMNIDKMSKMELILLKTKIELRLSFLEDNSDIYQLFYKCMTEELKNTTGAVYPKTYKGFTKKYKSGIVSNCKVAAENLHEIVVINLGDNYNTIKLAKFYKICISLGIEKIIEMDWNINIQTIVGMVDMFPTLFNKAYPFYIQFGWLNSLLEGEKVGEI